MELDLIRNSRQQKLSHVDRIVFPKSFSRYLGNNLSYGLIVSPIDKLSLVFGKFNPIYTPLERSQIAYISHFLCAWGKITQSLLQFLTLLLRTGYLQRQPSTLLANYLPILSDGSDYTIPPIIRTLQHRFRPLTSQKVSGSLEESG